MLEDAINALGDRHGRSRPASRRPSPRPLAQVFAAHPLRDLLTVEGPYPFFVDRERALFSSWYEFFPAPRAPTSTRRPARSSAGRCAPPPSDCRPSPTMGFDIDLPAADPPDRRGEPQGREQHAHARRPTTSARRGRSAARTAGTTRSTPTSAPSRTSTPSWPRRDGRPRGGAGLRAPGRARPPVGDRAPGVVHHPRRRHHRLRREPAEEVPGHLPDQLRQRPRGHLRRVRAAAPALDVARGADLPRRQPAHQAGRLLGVAARPDPRHRPGRVVPRPRRSPRRR